MMRSGRVPEATYDEPSPAPTEQSPSGAGSLEDVMTDTEELFNAAKYGDARRLRSCLELGTDVNARDRRGWTALMYACESGLTEPVKILLKAGADVNARTLKGWTALVPAARHGYTHVVNLLIRYGIDVNAATLRGWTPLKMAVFWNNVDTARVLLEAGANPMARDHDGESIFQCALRNTSNEMTELVREHCRKAAA